MATAFGLLGGVAASQGPEFTQQYRQRLGGAVDELRLQVERFDADARAVGRTRDDALNRLRGDPDELLRRQGEAAAANGERLARLERQRQGFVDAGPVARLGVMVRDFDPDLARATYRDFEPAMPVTREGFLATAIGFVAAWLGLHGIAATFRALWRRRPRRRRLRQHAGA
jgi:hypothetical protein